MIVRIMSGGKSFQGLSNYLTHDAEAQTTERVAWTHTHNLANDHAPSAVNEMLWTARDAELLKQEAGIRAGGRVTENPVKHVSLNWAPDDKPSREHMIETSDDFLRHMNWQEHQAIFVAHDDKAHAHVHVMLNVVHPETGLRLDDSFERRRAQAWALAYEREQGRIHCEQRLKNPEERENNPPRNIWMEFRENQEKFERDEKNMRTRDEFLAEQQKNQKNAEWQILKEIQRTERLDFFAQGKSEFSELRQSIYREVRDEFRDRWADFYAARRDGADPDALAALKAELVADQKSVLDARRDEACDELRESRDERYRGLLDHQHDIRLDLRARQEAGLDNGLFLEEVDERNTGDTMTAGFREAADQAATPQRSGAWEAAGIAARSEADAPITNSGSGTDGDIGVRLGFGVGSFLDSLFCDLVGPGPRPYRPDPAEAKLFQVAADDALKQQQQLEREQADEESRERRWAYGERAGT
jgi:hypothetical protein